MSFRNALQYRPATAQVRPLALLLAALAAVLVHALLVFGLPRWRTQPPKPMASDTVVASLDTRTITPPAPPEPAAAQPQPAAPVAEPVRPAEPVARPAPVRTPRPRLRPTPPPAESSAGAEASSTNDAASSPASAAPGPASAPDAETPAGAASASAPPASVPALVIPPELIALAKAPAKAPPSFVLDYDMTGEAKKMQYHASGQLQWNNQGDQVYNMAYTISAFLVGKRTQASQGTLGPHGLQPERFADLWRGEKAASFARTPGASPASAQGSIRFSNGSSEAPLLPGAQDQVSMFVQLLALFNADPKRYPAGTQLLLQGAGVRNAPLYRFRVDPEENVQAAGSEHRAIKLTQLRSEGQNKLMEIWLAPWQSGGQTWYLPVRMRISQDNGDFVEQTLKRMPG